MRRIESDEWRKWEMDNLRPVTRNACLVQINRFRSAAVVYSKLNVHLFLFCGVTHDMRDAGIFQLLILHYPTIDPNSLDSHD